MDGPQKKPGVLARLLAPLVALAAFAVLLPVASPAQASSVGDTISAGQVMRPGTHMRSTDGRFTLWMQNDGNLVVYQAGAGPKWSTRTWGQPGAFAVMQHDGNFVVYSSARRPLWHSGTYGTNARTASLQNDGNLVLRSSDSRTVWSRTGGRTANSSSTMAAVAKIRGGSRLTSPNGSHIAVMQNDGNFVVYRTGAGAQWSTRTWGNPGAFLVMQADGNLVVYSAASRPLWHSGTYGTDGRRLTLRDDGNLVVYNAGTTARWSRVTGIIRPTPPTPPAAEQAARWAEARLEQVWTRENRNAGWWSGWCEAFVEGAYGNRFWHRSAMQHYVARRNAGQIRGGVPPRGALVFWTAGGNDGHVAISVGNGQVVGTQGWSYQRLPVFRTSYTYFSGYLGWAMP
jgi:exopolysaccharide biosynthesis protein